MTRCSHESCSREHRIWLPKTINYLENMRSTSSSGRSDVSLHYWCVLCGNIQNISDDRSKKIGYWINILSKMTRECSLTQSQKRLIIMELESNEPFEDMYGTTGSAQRKVFVNAVKKYCNLCESTIDSFIF
jgi:hypothetical protein